MGNNQSTREYHQCYEKYHKDNYEVIDKGYCRVWKRLEDGCQHLQQYDMFIEGKKMLEAYQIMCHLRTNNQHLVNIHYFTHFPHGQVCGNFRKGIIMTERIIWRLSDLRLIPYQQSLAVLDQSIAKFELLHENYGPFKPDARMIGFQNSQQFRIKVWHHSKFSNLIPQFPDYTSKAHMINELVKSIQLHGKRPNHKLFSEYLNQVNHNVYFHGFQQLRLGLHRYCRKYKIDLNKDFSFIKNKIGLCENPKDTQLKQQIEILNQNVNFVRVNYLKKIDADSQEARHQKVNFNFLSKNNYDQPARPISYLPQCTKPEQSTMIYSTPANTQNSGFKNSFNQYKFPDFFTRKQQLRKIQNDIEILKMKANSLQGKLYINIGSDLIKIDKKQNGPAKNPFKDYEYDQTPIKKCNSSDNFTSYFAEKNSGRTQSQLKNATAKQYEKKGIIFKNNVVQQYYNTQINVKKQHQNSYNSEKLVPSFQFKTKQLISSRNSVKSWR